GVFIVYESIAKLIVGPEIKRLDVGAAISIVVTAINGLLGWYLIRTGRREQSLILSANGKHVLTDCWTTLGVIAALGLVWATGRQLFDPLLAILVAGNSP